MRLHGLIYTAVNKPLKKIDFFEKKDSQESYNQKKTATWKQAYPAVMRPYRIYQELMHKNDDKLHDLSSTKTSEESKIDSLIRQSDRILCRTKAVFPFDLFPDEIVVDETKVSIFRSNFLWTKNIQSILLENIAYVIINMIPFFATLTFEDVSFEGKERIDIRYLKRSEAIRIRQIIQGLIVGKKEGINFSKFSKKELIKKVEELGNVKGEEIL